MLWRHGVVVITAAELNSTKSELRFCAGSSPALGVSEIRDGEDLRQLSRLEIRLNTFRRSLYHKKKLSSSSSSSCSCINQFLSIAHEITNILIVVMMLKVFFLRIQKLLPRFDTMVLCLSWNKMVYQVIYVWFYRSI